MLVLAVNPVIETLGQLGAIIICLFLFIFVLLAVVFNLAMAFGLGWVRDKVQIIKMLRPNVESVNQVTASAMHGVPPSEHENGAMRAIASVPMRLNTVDKKVEQSADRVASLAIEVRARTVQAETIVKAFVSPFLKRRPQTVKDEGAQEIKSPGLHILMEEKGPVVPADAAVGMEQLQQLPGIPVSRLKNGSNR